MEKNDTAVDSETLSPKQKKLLRLLLAEKRILKRFNGRTLGEMERLDPQEQDILRLLNKVKVTYGPFGAVNGSEQYD